MRNLAETSIIFLAEHYGKLLLAVAPFAIAWVLSGFEAAVRSAAS